MVCDVVDLCLWNGNISVIMMDSSDAATEGSESASLDMDAYVTMKDVSVLSAA